MVQSLHRWLWKSLRRIESYRNKGMYGYIYSSSKKYSNQFVSHKKFLKYIYMFDTKIYVQFMYLSENITPMLLGE